MDDISILPWQQQPCHTDAGLRDGGHLWFSCPFVLKQKDQKFKAASIGPPHGCLNA